MARASISVRPTDGVVNEILLSDQVVSGSIHRRGESHPATSVCSAPGLPAAIINLAVCPVKRFWGDPKSVICKKRTHGERVSHGVCRPPCMQRLQRMPGALVIAVV